MATCPACGTSSRNDPTAITVSQVLAVAPIPGPWSVAGVFPKGPAAARLRLACQS